MTNLFQVYQLCTRILNNKIWQKLGQPIPNKEIKANPYYFILQFKNYKPKSTLRYR